MNHLKNIGALKADYEAGINSRVDIANKHGIFAKADPESVLELKLPHVGGRNSLIDNIPLVRYLITILGSLIFSCSSFS